MGVELPWIDHQAQILLNLCERIHHHQGIGSGLEQVEIGADLLCFEPEQPGKGGLQIEQEALRPGPGGGGAQLGLQR